MNSTRRSWIVLFLLLSLGAIAITSATIRLLAMNDASLHGIPANDETGLQHYLDYSVISLMHLIPGSLFLLLGPFQFNKRFRQRAPALHRNFGKIFIVAGLMVGFSALSMAILFPVIVSSFSTIGNALFGTALILCLLVAYRFVRQGNIAAHRQWMIRAYVIGLTPASMRVFILPLFVILGEDKIMPIMPALIWFSFSVQILIGEFIIRRSPKPRPGVSQTANTANA
ncbi:MAG: DUF2306 domain-containing protein [Gammaproteobacteria bacterium]|nr:DUF2306 domain-containing protein [Gammaproteobacteria bacterium]